MLQMGATLIQMDPERSKKMLDNIALQRSAEAGQRFAAKCSVNPFVPTVVTITTAFIEPN